MTRTPPAGSVEPKPMTRIEAAHPSGAPAVADPSPFVSGAVRPAQWYEQVYSSAAGDAAAIRWARGEPNPMMLAWLNAEAPGLIRPGARVVVIGSGLGDDVAALASRGYDVLGFDISPTAVDWARKRFPDITADFMVADLLDLPGRLRHRFDLVVEVFTLQSLPPGLREEAAKAAASMCSQRGIVLTICRARDETELLEHVDGPPWPLAVSELSGLMELSGLRPHKPVEDFLDDEQPPVRRLRGAFAR